MATSIMADDKTTEKITIWGIVQGVGFRPFVAKLAARQGLRGEVLNTGGLVEITVTDTPARLSEFLDALTSEKPKPAEIIHIEREHVPYREFEGFKISESLDGDKDAAMIPADLSICQSCISEMDDPANERHRHPFISCMECGPRYTIIDKMPYDRESTSMDDFQMCSFCSEQYTDIADRRYHAQTISCYECGPQLLYKAFGGEDIVGSTEELLSLAVKLLDEGKVIAVKGAGGYNFICDPFQDCAVAALRETKARESKPFAVMFLNAGQVSEYCEMSETEKNLLESSAKPILLLERKQVDKATGKENGPSEFKRSRFIGAFLPSMGLHRLLLKSCGKPLIVTSANVSGLPMVKDDDDMFALASKSKGLVAGTFYNKREIRVAVDDSVVRVIDGKPQMIRRSKGYAPVPLYVRALGQVPDKSTELLACGGQLKSAFALSKGAFSYVSQYFGDLDSLENMQVYEENVERMKTFFGINPKAVVCDMHPLYETTKYANKYASRHGAKLIVVQHHHAHVASVMAEHNLTGPVIGVSFDGTGYGLDGAVWGGEFLICEGGSFIRDAHLKYVTMVGGDALVSDAWKSAVSYALVHERGELVMCADDEFVVDITEIIAASNVTENENWHIVKEAVNKKINTVESSSMGRLFDAVSSLLGICHENSYEGECAILLEDAAARALKNPGGSEKDSLALKFHRQVADTVFKRCVKIRERDGINKVALTGGVFQNRVLTEMVLKLLRDGGFDVYYNISVSPNDGGIALGQNYIGMCLLAV
ncbi:MAG: carbamoyltransferase HypF [Clostridiales bacterium]|nr:carbamoyltransferase HypF [Clostridiales bacterium]